MPVWKNVWVEPETMVGPVETGEKGDRQVEVRVTGLLCHNLCIARVRRALSRRPGVSSVTPVPGDGRFLVRFQGQPDVEGLRCAVQGQVMFRRARRLFGAVGRTCRIRDGSGSVDGKSGGPS